MEIPRYSNSGHQLVSLLVSWPYIYIYIELWTGVYLYIYLSICIFVYLAMYMAICMAIYIGLQIYNGKEQYLSCEFWFLLCREALGEFEGGKGLVRLQYSNFGP